MAPLLLPASGPTSYPEVNAILHELLLSVRAILGDRFVGMYLYGSLAAGDFSPYSSDIDFLVVTDAGLSGNLVAALQAMHRRLAALDTPWANELEGSYIPVQALRRYRQDQANHPHIDRGGSGLAVEPHASDWVFQRHILREHGVTLAGPPPQTLIDPVSPDELRAAVLSLLNEWWPPMLQTPSRLQHGGYQMYAVLTMCRALYTLEHVTIVSKPVAARWAQRELGEEYSALISRALAWQHPELRADPAEIDRTLGLLKYVVERSRRHNHPSPPPDSD